MYKMIFVGGLVASILSFLTGVFLFFYFKIPMVYEYITKKKLTILRISQSGRVKTVSVEEDSRTRHLNSTGFIGNIEGKMTTEHIKSTSHFTAQNYATAILEADSTEILPEIIDKK